MSNILFVLIFMLLQTNCFNEYNSDLGIPIYIDGYNGIIEPGLSQTYFIPYQKETNFQFNISTQDILQINIHGINCNFKLEFEGETINKINLDTYSFIINSNNKNITIIPLLDIIDGEYKENYEKKSCPLSINSYLINIEEPKLKIENKEESWLYLNHSNYTLLNILYNIKEVSFDSFAALSFKFNKKSNFLITVNYTNNYKHYSLISEEINDSRNIFLNSSFLLFDENIEQSNTGGSLSIIIENKASKVINLNFKIIEKDTISFLEKNALNYGFLTSKTIHQYYYTEILQGEEGELMLHNKLLYGELYGKIVDKNEINKKKLYNTSFYPNKILDDDNYLKYNLHQLRLNFSYENTLHCSNGCYLLISYEQKIYEDNDTTIKNDKSLIGYEYTIFLRFWNFTDYISQIIDIPYNEYLINSFVKGSVNTHYYSITIPDDAIKLIIQIEGNYLDGFYWKGRIKINTDKTIGNISSLNIINPKNLITLDVKDLNYSENRISFAFRPKDNHADIYSFYYFRILYITENESMYYPVDSYLGNLCIPESDNNTDKFYCNLILKNNYDELLSKFAITSTTQNEYFLINVTKYFLNGSSSEETAKFTYLYKDIDENIDYCIFKFEFPNNELKFIKSSFFDVIKDVYPQIYTLEMFYMNNYTKTNHFKLVNNYTLKYQFVYGEGGTVRLSFYRYEAFYSSRNFKGKPLAFPVGSETDNITCTTRDKDDIYFLELIYKMKNKVIDELKTGETISNFIKAGQFPLYYYIKVKNDSYINYDINLRLNSYDDSLLHNNFSIKGYVVNEETIKRKINGEYIQLNEPIMGYYSDAFKVALLQINQKIEDNKNYILIQILNNDQDNFNSYLLVEIVTKEKNDNIYFLPINQYILETFDGDNDEIRTENKYYLCSKDKTYGKGVDPALIEISSGFSDIVIEFEKSSNVDYEFDLYYTGFNKYYVKDGKNDDIYFKVVNPRKRKNANYMMRYYFTGKNAGIIYNLDTTPIIDTIKEDEKYVSISLTFKGFVLKYSVNYLKKNFIYFYIYGLLFKDDENSDEQLNTTSKLVEREPLFINHTRHNYSFYDPGKWSLIFENIPREKNYVYKLQIKVNSFIEYNIFNEEFLIFTTKINLTHIKPEENKDYTLYIVIPIVGFVVLFLVAFFLIKYIRLQKSNKDLREDLKSMAYSNDIQKNVLIKDKKYSQKDSDYESTFI